MYGYIRGKITEIDSRYVIIENNDIGYIIYVPNPYSYQLNNIYTIFTYANVKEEEYTLYGFKDREQKELFLKLISVKGLGPKMALPIIATGTFSSIADAIENNNLSYLKKFPKEKNRQLKIINFLKNNNDDEIINWNNFLRTYSCEWTYLC